MARNFSKIPKTKGSPNVKNTNRKGLLRVNKDGEKGSCCIKYTPLPLDMNSLPIKAILYCRVTLDDSKLLNGIIICPYRRDTIKTLLFKFGVEKFNTAQVDVIKCVGEAI